MKRPSTSGIVFTCLIFLTLTIPVLAILSPQVKLEGSSGVAVIGAPNKPSKAITVPAKHVEALKLLVEAAQLSQNKLQFATSIFLDRESPCVKQVLSGLQGDAEAKFERLNNGILKEQIALDVPKDWVLQVPSPDSGETEWQFVPPTPQKKP